MIVKSLKKADGSLSRSDKESADVLCQKFQPVFVHHGITNQRSLLSVCSSLNEGLYAHELFTEDIVYIRSCRC